MTKSITVRTFQRHKQEGKKISMVTAYDHPTAKLLDEAGVDSLLIGDSLGMVVQGQSTTLPVTLDDIIYHTKMVTRATTRPLIVADMPFLTHLISVEEALRNAGRILQEGGAHAVKIEGGSQIAPTVHRLVQAGIPVVAHVGLMPQGVHVLGGFSVQGRREHEVSKMFDDVQALQQAGAFAIVLEMVPAEVASAVSARLTIPTIGIGAGAGCDGQVLVFHDMMGFTSGYIPKHNKRYANLAEIILNSARDYVREVREGQFPSADQTVYLKPEEQVALSFLLKGDVP